MRFMLWHVDLENESSVGGLLVIGVCSPRPSGSLAPSELSSRRYACSWWVRSIMIRLLRHLVALPFLYAGTVALWLQQSWSTTLLVWAWHIGHDGKMGRTALAAINQTQGTAEALDHGLAWSAVHPAPDVVTMTGLLALSCGRLDDAYACVETAASVGEDAEGYIHLLRLHLAEQQPDAGPLMREMADELVARNDLNPTVTMFALNEAAWSAVFTDRNEDAAIHTQRLARTGQNGNTNALQYVLAYRAGRVHDEFVPLPDEPPEESIISRAFVAAALGDDDNCAEHLSELSDTSVRSMLVHRIARWRAS